MSDDYRQPGKTIAEIHGLEENDPWQPEAVSELKKIMDEYAAEEKKILDEMFQRGMIPSPVPPAEPVEDELMPEFEDPEDDEDPRVLPESTLTIFWRMTVPNKRLKQLVDFNPDLPKIILTGKNTSAGCWCAFTGAKTANRIANTLNGCGIITSVDTCDINGNQIDLDTFVNQREVAEWRPWNPIGTQEDVVIRADEFFYCINHETHGSRACFVPETYWNGHGTVFGEPLGIDVLLDGFKPVSDKPYSFYSPRKLIDAKTALDKAGFRENLIFHAYVNEHEL